MGRSHIGTSSQFSSSWQYNWLAGAALTIALLLSGCASRELRTSISSEAPVAILQRELAWAETKERGNSQQLADYLRIAEITSERLEHRPSEGADDDSLINTYDRAVADFVTSWSDQNRPQEIRDVRSDRKIRLVLVPSLGGGWPASYFESFENARRVDHRRFWRSNEQRGLGGTLVGVHPTVGAGEAPPRLEPPKGFRIAVTALLRFTERPKSSETEAQLELVNPRTQDSVQLGKRKYPPAADFTAPMAIYTKVSEFWAGVVNMVWGEKTQARSGLYLLEPYDPNRIPVIFVHGLLSSGYTWLNVANAVRADAEIRKKYQVWIFFYPTGNPILYSALRLREDLALAQAKYGLKHGVVLIGHSMGGILCRLQATDIGAADWIAVFHARATKILPLVESKPLLKRALIFHANPLVKRIIFISTPHRGSAIASGGIGALGTRLIRLPATIASSVPKQIARLANARGLRIPTSIDGLSPQSPLFKVYDRLAIRSPHHSIIGDRGRGDTPNSSDGVVPYSSSHLDTASSELIVPTGHGAMNSPLAIAEIQRILRLSAGEARSELKSNGRTADVVTLCCTLALTSGNTDSWPQRRQVDLAGFEED
jgi:pimeloyl-ACP methyl ester carboxylesterase